MGVAGIFGQRYLRWSEWRSTEAFAPYLGVVGVVGLGWLVGVAVLAVWRRRRVPGGAWVVGWVLAFASVGGFTNAFAFFTGLGLFRASNRFSVFISAVALLFLVSQLARLSRSWPAAWRVVGAGALAMFGLVDQLPRPMAPEKWERMARMAKNDLDFGRRLEAALPAGAMVFQLPVVTFPEAPPQYQLGDGEHFRPFLATETLRFSYGALKGRSRGQWQRDLAQMTTAEKVEALESSGFAAIYLNRRGFADRGETLLAELAALGCTERIEGARREQIVVRLRPVARPVPPVARVLTFGRGWHRPPYGSPAGGSPVEPRWADEDATMAFFNPYPIEKDFVVTLRLSGVGAQRTLQLGVNDRDELEVDLTTTVQEFRRIVRLKPGANHFDLQSPEPAVRLSPERRQLRKFAVHEAKIRLAERGDENER